MWQTLSNELSCKRLLVDGAALSNRSFASIGAGNEAVRKGDFQAAVGLYSEAIAIDPTNPFYYVNRCVFEANLGLFKFLVSAFLGDTYVNT